MSTTFVIFLESRQPAFSSGAVWESKRLATRCQLLSEICFINDPEGLFPSSGGGI
jgi:hypothetical protein